MRPCLPSLWSTGSIEPAYRAENEAQRGANSRAVGRTPRDGGGLSSMLALSCYATSPNALRRSTVLAQ